MNPNKSEITSESSRIHPLLEKEHGFYHSANLTLSVDEVYKACQDKSKFDRVLQDLPDNVENFLDLVLQKFEQIGNKQYKVVWENHESSKVSGTLTLLLTESIGRPGTWITAEANFSKFNFNSEGPSTVINIFLKRLKALIETGEIPSIKGQPSGREKIPKKENKTLH